MLRSMFANRGRIKSYVRGTMMETAKHLQCFTAGEEDQRFKQVMLLELINTCHHTVRDIFVDNESLKAMHMQNIFIIYSCLISILLLTSGNSNIHSQKYIPIIAHLYLNLIQCQFIMYTPPN